MSYLAMCSRALWLGVALAIGCSGGRENHGGSGAPSDGADAGNAATGGSGGSSGTGGTGGLSGEGGAGSEASSGADGGSSAGGGGTGGAAGTSASGGSGGDAVDHAACAPATHHFRRFDWREVEGLVDCVDPPTNNRVLDSRIPNVGSTAGSEEVVLDAPILAGTQAAVSLMTQESPTLGTVELWGGAGEVCGPATELLWWNYLESRVVCATFTPTEDVTRLMLVVREQELINGQFSQGIYDVSICPAGACPGEQGGYGRMPGMPLEAPNPVYTSLRDSAGASAVVFMLGGYDEGFLYQRYADRLIPEEPSALSHAVFRTGPYDRFGDAVYCGGEGSTYTDFREDNEELLHLSGITRLPCASSGEASAVVTIEHDNSTAGTVEVATDVPGYAMTGAKLSARGCSGPYCHFHFWLGSDRATAHSTHLHLAADGEVARDGTPIAIVSATWVRMPVGDAVPEAVCIGGGELRYAPDGTTTITLTGVTAPNACPGEPVMPEEAEIWLDWN